PDRVGEDVGAGELKEDRRVAEPRHARRAVGDGVEEAGRVERHTRRGRLLLAGEEELEEEPGVLPASGVLVAGRREGPGVAEALRRVVRPVVPGVRTDGEGRATSHAGRAGGRARGRAGGRVEFRGSPRRKRGTPQRSGGNRRAGRGCNAAGTPPPYLLACTTSPWATPTPSRRRATTSNSP